MTTTSNDYLNESLAAYKMLVSQYGSETLRRFWGVSGDNKDMMKKFSLALKSIGVQIKDINDFTIFIMDQNKLEPVRIDELQNIFKKFVTQKAEDNENEECSIINEMEMAYQEAFRFLTLRYGNLFKSKSFSVKAQYQHWRDEIIRSELSLEAIKEGINLVRNSSEYVSYPPNSAQFITLCRISALGNDFPTFNDAYIRASRQREIKNEHPVVIRLRQKFDYNSIIGFNTSSSTKSAMEREYHIIINEILKGKDILVSKNDGDEKTNKEPIAPLSDRVRFLRSLI